MNFRHYYKSGDLIRYYDSASLNKEDHKLRPAMVLSYNKRNDSVYAVRITSKNGRTEKEDYVLLSDEVRVPSGIRYIEDDLHGVIKTNNIVELKRDEIISTLNVFPLETKIEVLNIYDKFRHEYWYNKYFDHTGLDCQRIIDRFKENLVAEKLGFFYCLKNNENIYEFVRDNRVKIDHIQFLDKRGNTFIYNILFKHKGVIYDYNIATNKTKEQIIHDWSGSKKVSEWLHEDIKYHILMKRFHSKIKPDPVPKMNKYLTFSKFKESVQNDKNKNMDIPFSHGKEREIG